MQPSSRTDEGRDAAETSDLKKWRRILVAVLLLLMALVTPDTLNLSAGTSQMVSVNGSEKSCVSMELWNVPRLKIAVNLIVLTRPTDYAVVWSSTLDYRSGVAMTLDNFGNLFLSTPSALWGVREPIVFLLSSPFEPGSLHQVIVEVDSGAISSAQVDGEDVEIRSLDGTVRASDQILKTAMNRMCAGNSTIRPVAGEVKLSVIASAAPRTFQLGLLRLALMAISLALFLRTDELKYKRQDGENDETSH